MHAVEFSTKDIPGPDLVARLLACLQDKLETTGIAAGSAQGSPQKIPDAPRQSRPRNAACPMSREGWRRCARSSEGPWSSHVVALMQRWARRRLQREHREHTQTLAGPCCHLALNGTPTCMHEAHATLIRLQQWKHCLYISHLSLGGVHRKLTHATEDKNRKLLQRVSAVRRIAQS